MNLEKKFVPHELSVKLKELGFNEPCFAWYDVNSFNTIELEFEYKNNKDLYFKESCTAPLYQQCFDWFRKNYDLTSWVYQSNSELFHYSILRNGRFLTTHCENTVTYEEARLECLKKLIELCEKN